MLLLRQEVCSWSQMPESKDSSLDITPEAEEEDEP